MAYHTTIFGQMLQLISRLEFQNIVHKYKGDFRSRSLKCWGQFIHLLYFQLAARQSLRDTVQCTMSQRNKFYHLGCAPVARSTLSDANNKRSHEIYETLFYKLLERTQNIAPKYKLDLPRNLYIMDSTTIDLCLSIFPWAHFRKTKAAIKIHTLIQADGSLPVFLNITDGKVSDCKGAKDICVPPGSFLVIDRGYHDFDQYKAYKNNKIRFITRIKTNASYIVKRDNKCNKAEGILSDEIIRFTGHYTNKKYPHPLRRIYYHDKTTNKKLVFLTNDLSLNAITISQIYKARWEIELFFKTIKQNLKIKSFIGTLRNAVLTQIRIAMIAYLLNSCHKFSRKARYSIQNLFRLIQINLFESTHLIDLFKYGGHRPPDSVCVVQYTLF